MSEDATKDLDEEGIVREGARVKEGDILIEKLHLKVNLILPLKKNCCVQFLVKRLGKLKMLLKELSLELKDVY